MKMINQHSKELDKHIQKSGCYFLCLLWIIQIENRIVLSAKNINDIYTYMVDNSWMDENCTIKKPDNILNYLLDTVKIHQIGQKQDDEDETYWSWVKDKEYDWVIMQHKTSGSIGTHFTVGDKNWNEFYDPLDGRGYNSSGINRWIFYKVF